MTSDFLPDHKISTAEEMCSVIRKIIQIRHGKAAASEYDVGVCIRSITFASNVFENIPVQGTPFEYAHVVESALDSLVENYYDHAGVYTSKGMIGDIGLEVYELIQSQANNQFAAVDRQEAEACLAQEMIKLMTITSGYFEESTEAIVKTQVTGATGAQYFIAMRFEIHNEKGKVLVGAIYNNDSYLHPLSDERFERII